MLIDALAAREFLDAVIAAFASMGGMMAFTSGYAAIRAQARNASPEALARAINEGIADGFRGGAVLAVAAFIIMGWS